MKTMIVAYTYALNQIVSSVFIVLHQIPFSLLHHVTTLVFFFFFKDLSQFTFFYKT